MARGPTVSVVLGTSNGERSSRSRYGAGVEHQQVSRLRLYGSDKRVAALECLCAKGAGGVYRAVHDGRFRLRSFARDLHCVVSADLPVARQPS